jgi:protein SCO1/2
MTLRPMLASFALVALALAASTAVPGAAAPVAATTAAPAAPAALPGDSVYRLRAPLVDQDGRAFDFADGAGAPRLVSMFYTSCKVVCPLIVDTLRATERAVAAGGGDGPRVLLVSFDPENDTPAALKAVADKRHIDTRRWTLARAQAPDVRRIAAVLGIQYRQLQNHEFSHSSALVLLDAQGRVVARTDRLGEADPEFVAAVRRVLAAQG